MKQKLTKNELLEKNIFSDSIVLLAMLAKKEHQRYKDIVGSIENFTGYKVKPSAFSKTFCDLEIHKKGENLKTLIEKRDPKIKKEGQDIVVDPKRYERQNLLTDLKQFLNYLL